MIVCLPVFPDQLVTGIVGVLDLSFSVCDLRNVPIRIILVMDLVIVLQTLPGKPFQLVGLAAVCPVKYHFASILIHSFFACHVTSYFDFFHFRSFP